ncbi:MAG: J domain-containing protein [Actinobacteria bacterium]|nr:MAG: J domain-containing protein [Actinomycetota bacterium]
MPEREWADKDYYATLGVQKGAAEADIKKSYRKLAQKYHPDANPGDTAAEERFKEVSHAYDVLSDPKTRKEYDDFREMLASGFGGFGGAGGTGGGRRIRFEDLGDLGDIFTRAGQSGTGNVFTDDIFGSIFGRAGGARAGRATKGRDQETEIALAFREALEGTTANLHLTEPGGKQRSIKVRIPAGVSDGARIRVPRKGDESPNGGPPGDLFVKVSVVPHQIFGRKGRDLTLNLPITYPEAALGADVKVPTLDGGTVTLKIPAGTQAGKTFRIRGKGGGSNGSLGDKTDLLVTVNVVVPQKLTKEARELLEKFAGVQPESPREHLGKATGARG